MFDRLKHSFTQSRREHAIKAALRNNRVQISLLHETLFLNIAQDDLYADFPRLPSMPRKEWRKAGPYRFKILTNLTRGNNRVGIRVHHQDSWLGTLSFADMSTTEAILTLPHDLISASDISSQAERIFTALVALDVEDTASRTRAVAA